MPRRKLDKPRYRLRERGGIWYVFWTERGRTCRESTGTGDKAAAQVYLEALEQARHSPSQPDRKTIAAILDGYLADRRGQVVAHQRLVEASIPLKKHMGWLLYSDIKTEHSRIYAERREAGTRTIIKELGTLAAALHWAVREEWIDAAPAIIKPSAPAKKDRWLTREEADRLVDAARQTPHIYLFVMIARHTGARKGAIEGLIWDRVDFENGMIDFRDPELTLTRKGRAVVPMNSALREALKAAYEIRTCGHVLEWCGAPAGNVKKAFARAATRASLHGITPHVIRHSVATWMARDGVPMRKIAKFLAHDDERTTAKIYAHHSPDWLRDEAESLV